VAQQLRARLGQDVCLIALTGYGQEEDRRRTLEAGFNAHLVKPVNPEELSQLLADLPFAPG
jgi:CheY-like chemotaxis protein